MSGKQAVGRIPAVAPLPSILSSATDRSGEWGNWRTGIAWTPGCISSFVEGRCSTDEREAADGPLAAVATDTFTVYTPAKCEYVVTKTGDEIDALSRDLTDVHTARAVARALWLGEGLDDVVDPVYGLPPTLRRVATDISVNGGPVALDDVVAHLLHAYEDCTGGNGGAVLHIPTVLIPGALGGGDGGARVAWPEGTFYRGPNGSKVSPGPGYPSGISAQGADGFGPLVPDSDPEQYLGSGYDEVWVYISGPVEYALGTLELPNTVEERHMPAQLNAYEAIASRDALVRFDPCCVFAALAVNTAGEVS